MIKKMYKLNKNNTTYEFDCISLNETYLNKYYRNALQIMKDKIYKEINFSRRSFIFLTIKLALLSFISYYFKYLQINQHDKYLKFARKNYLRILKIDSSRGTIISHDQQKIAHSSIKYSIYIKNIEHSSIATIIDILSNPEEEVKFKISNIGPKYTFSAQNLTWEQLIKVQSTITQHISVGVMQQRIYPFGPLLSTVTGYVIYEKKITSGQIHYENYTLRGQSGIEKYYDEELSGKPGEQHIEVDSMGNILKNDKVFPPISGENIFLTIDTRIQQIVANNLKEKNANAIILNPDTGEILAMYTTNNYDPNILNNISTKSWNELLNSPQRPLFNRCVSALYPPASIYKLAVALGLLEHGIDPEKKIKCTGGLTIGGRFYHCWKHSGHGLVSISQAIAYSCNVYFYTMSHEIGMQNITQIAKLLGLGEKTHIDLPFAARGIVADDIWKMEKLKKKWTVGDTANSAIGQGYNLVTIVQIAQMIARIHSGKIIIPRLCKNKNYSEESSHNLEKKENNENYVKNFINELLPCREKNLEIVRRAMESAMKEHKIHNKCGKSIILAGKTGTSQTISTIKAQSQEKKEHSMFAGYMLSKNYLSQDYAIALIIENGGWGKDSISVVKKIFGEILKIQS